MLSCDYQLLVEEFLWMKFAVFSNIFPNGLCWSKGRERIIRQFDCPIELLNWTDQFEHQLSNFWPTKFQAKNLIESSMGFKLSRSIDRVDLSSTEWIQCIEYHGIEAISVKSTSEVQAVNSNNSPGVRKAFERLELVWSNWLATNHRDFQFSIATTIAMLTGSAPSTHWSVYCPIQTIQSTQSTMSDRSNPHNPIHTIQSIQSTIRLTPSTLSKQSDRWTIAGRNLLISARSMAIEPVYFNDGQLAPTRFES